jgi:hypothetical protein
VLKLRLKKEKIGDSYFVIKTRNFKQIDISNLQHTSYYIRLFALTKNKKKEKKEVRYARP